MNDQEARSILALSKHVVLTDQPDGLQIRISASADKGFWFVPICFISCAAGLVLAWVLWKHARMPMNAARVLGLSAMGFMAGMIGLLVRIASGGPKDQLITIHEGSVSIDRYLSGDHIVKTYDARQVQSVFAEVGTVFVVTSISDTQVAFSLPEDAAKALATLMATYLWSGAPLETSTQPVGVGHTINRTWFAPQSLPSPAPPTP